MSNLIDFYKTQVRILWEWRGGRRALLKRLVITLLISTVSLLVAGAILPGRLDRAAPRRRRRGRS